MGSLYGRVRALPGFGRLSEAAQDVLLEVAAYEFQTAALWLETRDRSVLEGFLTRAPRFADHVSLLLSDEPPKEEGAPEWEEIEVHEDADPTPEELAEDDLAEGDDGEAQTA